MAMADYERIAEQLSEQFDATFRPASPLDLAKLEDLGLPESVIDFYRDFEPCQAIEGQVRLWPIERIVEENDTLLPGCYTSRLGFVVFASTLSGDAYCFNTTREAPKDQPPIVLISQDVVGEETKEGHLFRVAKPIARNLEEFLEMFLQGEIDEECIYG
jgi:hypothetical protein